MKLNILGAVLLFLMVPLFVAAQEDLRGLSYSKLQRQIELYQGNPKVWLYLNGYLAKAKKEKNYPEMVAAYKEMLHECDENLRLSYSDSMVWAAKKAKNDDLLGSSYLTRGVVFYQRKEHLQALDNYLLANKYLVNSSDAYLKHKVKYSMALLKYYLGYYNEAISLFDQCIKYFKDQEPLPYLQCLHSQTLCYIAVNNIELAIKANKLAMEESLRFGVNDLVPFIDCAAGIIAYKDGNYKKAIQNISLALPQISKEDFANESMAHFYLGASYWDMGQRETAVKHFKEVDKLFVTRRYMRPELRKNYEFLIKYYHQQQKPEEELKYINQLLVADSLLGKEFRYLVRKVHKEYDTAELLAEKQKIQDELMRSRWTGSILWGLAGLLALSTVYLILRHKKLQKLYKQRFDQLIKKDMQIAENTVIATPKELEINPAIVEGILGKLQEFENKKGFLKKELTATKLAESFHPNYKYLSNIVRHSRNKSFVNYINDLRIDYIVMRLKEEPMLRRYTNGALASEAGFSTAQHFTTAFKKRTGISPGYFVEELSKRES